VFSIGNRLRFWAWELSEPYHESRTVRDFEKIRLLTQHVIQLSDVDLLVQDEPKMKFTFLMFG